MSRWPWACLAMSFSIIKRLSAGGTQRLHNTKHLWILIQVIRFMAPMHWCILGDSSRFAADSAEGDSFVFCIRSGLSLSAPWLPPCPAVLKVFLLHCLFWFLAFPPLFLCWFAGDSNSTESVQSLGGFNIPSETTYHIYQYENIMYIVKLFLIRAFSILL